MKKQKLLYAILAVVMAAVLVLALPTDVSVKINGGLLRSGTTAQTTAATAAQGTVSETAAPSDTTAPAAQGSAAATSNEEIIKKYTMLVDKFKQEKPAYKRLEYQAMPEEYRNFSSAVNMVLEIASGYMTTKDQAETIERPAGAPEILNDMPIHGTEKGCVLTNYDAVAWAKDEDLGNGTRKISFSLKEEMNAAPTPADTGVPVSNHGAVMQPLEMDTIMTEVNNVTSKLPGVSLNYFDLKYNDCVFECVYDPATNQVQSITHYIVIDIEASLHLIKDITGSVRITNDMFISDITW